MSREERIRGMLASAPRDHHSSRMVVWSDVVRSWLGEATWGVFWVSSARALRLCVVSLTAFCVFASANTIASGRSANEGDRSRSEVAAATARPIMYEFYADW